MGEPWGYKEIFWDWFKPYEKLDAGKFTSYCLFSFSLQVTEQILVSKILYLYYLKVVFSFSKMDTYINCLRKKITVIVFQG